jgi:hypothetical protein
LPGSFGKQGEDGIEGDALAGFVAVGISADFRLSVS